MTTDSLADRILQALVGEAAPTRADADALADALRAVLTKGTPQQVTDLLSRLVRAGVIIVQGDVNVAGDGALLITRSDVQLAPGQDVILEALQTFRRRIAEDQALQSQVRVAEYLVALRDYCASLPYRTLHNVRLPKTLDEVYVPLKARPEQRKERQDLSGLERSEPLSIAEVMRKCEQPHVLILGEPGAGKSTLLLQLAEHAWDVPNKIGLDAPYLPILVPLRRLASAEGALEDRLNHALAAELTLTQALPQGFFTNWPKQTGANWLILLDALDEVPAEQRAQLMQWLKGLLSRIGQNRVVLTSRPSGYRQDELEEKLFGHYDLLSFTPDQIGEFAHKWFEDEAEQFLKELERVRAGALSGTPLLLTIAAKVYLEKGTLPERRSALYDQFVGIWLAEAEQRGLRTELGDPVCDVARFALARLALAMTEQPTQSEAALSQIAATYLRDAIPLSADRAQVMGERFVRVMALRSGVFTCRGDTYDFIHPTFREYLVAWVFMRECRQDAVYDLEQAWQRVVSRWADENWREAAQFALGILSDAEQDVTALVERIWPGRSDEPGGPVRSEEGLRFAGIVLAEQVKVGTCLSDDTIEALLARARRVWLRDWSIPLLGELYGYPRVGDGLLTLARDEKVGRGVRVRAAEVLGCLGQIDESMFVLLALARDEKADRWTRLRAAEAMGRLGLAEGAVSILLTLARDETVDTDVRMRAADALCKLGQADDLLALARDEKVDRRARVRAAEALDKLGRAEEAAQAWLSLARDEKVDEWVRGHATEALGALGRAEDLLALARDEKANMYLRERAAVALGKLGRADEAATILLALARDKKANTNVHMRAAAALGELWRGGDLLSLARDKGVDGQMRERAAATLGKLGRADNLLMLLRDEEVGLWVRECAAVALGKLGRADELMVLAHDKKVDRGGRKEAARALGRFVGTRAIPDLERIEQEEMDEDVRREVHRAIKRIQRRAHGSERS